MGDASSCTSAGALASNVQVSLSPANPKIGDTYTLSTSYDLSADVTGGSAQYKVSLSGFPVVNEKHDLCDDLKDGPTPCPLKAGPISSSITGTVPSSTPHGSYDSTITWTDSNGSEVLCLKFDFSV